MVYASHYGFHRGNIVTDEKLDSGVYAYGDIGELAPVDLRQNGTKYMVIGVMAGWLAKSDHDKNGSISTHDHARYSEYLHRSTRVQIFHGLCRRRIS